MLFNYRVVIYFDSALLIWFDASIPSSFNLFPFYCYGFYITPFISLFVLLPFFLAVLSSSVRFIYFQFSLFQISTFVCLDLIYSVLSLSGSFSASFFLYTYTYFFLLYIYIYISLFHLLSFSFILSQFVKLLLIFSVGSHLILTC